MATDKHLQFRDTGAYIYSPGAGQIQIVATATGNDDISFNGTVLCYQPLTMLEDKHLQFRDSGVYIFSSDDGKLQIVADGTGNDDISFNGTVLCYQNLTMSDDKIIYLYGTTDYIYANSSGQVIIVGSNATAAINFSPTSGYINCNGYLRLKLVTVGTSEVEGTIWYEWNTKTVAYYNGTAIKTLQTD